MRAFAEFVDSLNERTGRFVSWFTLAVVLIQFTVVLMRYVFGVGSIWAQESILYLHSMLFMLAAAYTLRHDGHVRVDIFYREARPRAKALVNLFGALVFILPVCLLILKVATPYVLQSWSIFEGSKETSGIPGIFVLKTAILIFAVQMALQGLSMAAHSLLALGGDEAELDALRFHGN
ncbi:MAG: TRAP transporter small permease subunit [Hyphomicrobiales bacterium]